MQFALHAQAKVLDDICPSFIQKTLLLIGASIGSLISAISA
jgi:hypothetical protein